MCRHTAWLGRPRSLQELLVDPPHGLLRQSWAPRRQRYGTVNADGFGVGWWTDGVVARYRRSLPMWGDPSFLSLAPVVRSGCVVAAVRSATVGQPGGEEACAPFQLPGDVLLSHNGALPVEAVAPLVASAQLAEVGSTVDSAFVAALVGAELHRGLARALVAAVRRVADVAPDARVNLLGSDGSTVAATTWGDTLFWRVEEGGAVVASEPSDDADDWTEVPDRSLLELTVDGVAVHPVEDCFP